MSSILVGERAERGESESGEGLESGEYRGRGSGEDDMTVWKVFERLWRAFGDDLKLERFI